MDRKLRDILGKLAAGRDATGLGDDDWAVIDQAVGRRAAVDPDAPRPLWAHIREQVLRWKAVFELPIDWLGADTDAVFLDAGVPTSFRLDSGAARRFAPVRRDALVRSVQKHLGHEYGSVRAVAAMLIGLARLDELVPSLIEALTSGREERNSWGAAQVIGPMLESLAMLEHPQARDLAAKFVSHSDDRLRRAAQVCTLLSADQLDDADLARALDGSIASSVLLAFPEALIRASKGGLALAPRLATAQSNLYRASDGAALALIARKAELRDYHRDLLGSSSYDLKLAAIVDLMGSDATWAIDAARAQLAVEHDDTAAAALVATISTLLPDDAARRAWIGEKLGSSRAGERAGAGWAALPVSGLTDKLRALIGDSDEEVRRAIGTALLVGDDACSPELLEVRWLELSRHWRAWNLRIATRMLGQTRQAAPWVARDAELIGEGQPPWQRAELDATVAFYRAAPSRLIRRLSPDITSNETVRIRAVHLAGHIGGPVLAAALEQRLAACDAWTECVELCIECACAGGPTTPVGRTAARLMIHEASTPVTLEPDDLMPTVVLAARADSMIRSRAASALHQLGDAAVPYLGVLAQNGNDQTLGKAVGQALAQLSGASDIYVGELADLMAGRTKRLADLTLLELITCTGAPAIRAKVAEAAVHADNPWAEVARHVVTLAGDAQQDVAVSALTALARRAGSERWVQAMLLEKSRSDDWTVSRQTIDIMGSSAHASFVPRLTEMLARSLVDNDQDRGTRCVAALEQIADANPDRGLAVLDIRDPHMVNTRYGMQENVDWNTDKRAESVRLLMLALDKRKDALAAAAAKGKTALFTRSHNAMGPARPLSSAEFDRLAVFFRVTFSDADSGDIVAEVGDEPTGELVNALLQGSSVSVTHGTWS